MQAPGGETNLRQIDVGGVPPERRLQAWADAIYDSYYPVDLTNPAATAFRRGELAIFDLAGARFCMVDCDPMLVDRRRCHIGDGGDYYMLPVPRRQPLELHQGGRQARIAPSDLGMIGTADTYRYLQASPDTLTTLRIEGPMARDRLPLIDDLTARTMAGNAPLVRIFLDFMEAIVAQRTQLSPAEAARLVPQLLDLLALALTAPAAALESDESAVRLAHLRRLYRAIDRHLGEERLGPDFLARDLGLSPRYVQKLLAARGETVSATIRARRMAAARIRLADPARRGHSVATIAYGLGFADPAHFSRLFKAETGLSPRDWRRQRMQGNA
ncbi:helix-turn-helix domain-containing protein [Marinibaculum pumilum]|uniref:Helix-turn-helix domain-containing protein n=1 Tax=Marinibaculum pumilum TaxID=1766165 RepID=A0ABV7L631_9PROT